MHDLKTAFFPHLQTFLVQTFYSAGIPENNKLVYKIVDIWEKKGFWDSTIIMGFRSALEFASTTRFQHQQFQQNHQHQQPPPYSGPPSTFPNPVPFPSLDTVPQFYSHSPAYSKLPTQIPPFSVGEQLPPPPPPPPRLDAYGGPSRDALIPPSPMTPLPGSILSNSMIHPFPLNGMNGNADWPATPGNDLKRSHLLYVIIIMILFIYFSIFTG